MSAASIPSKQEMESAYEVIRKLRMPSVPDIITEVQKLLQEPNLRIDDITNLISQDATLTGEVLKAARSPLYGLSEDVTTIFHAVKVLGVKRLNEITIAVALKASLHPMNAFHAKLWEESMLVAAGCAWLASASGHVDRDEAYLAGLFSNIGCMLLSQGNKKYEILYEKARAYPLTTHELEVRLMNTNHSVVGFIVAELWSLPSRVCKSIYHMHDASITPEHVDDLGTLISVIRIATGYMERVRLVDVPETMEFLKFHDAAREEIMMEEATYEEFSEYMESLI
ncbi:HDOD domain-containing protein [Litoribrevibacter euphylliae]|uniref:HDOD domain-containing protein n=1 Tax=Litoribrevibacter euphylliae TaxID=1834034 RepID=A0ABV7HGT0_9GAMM